jgi:hypothetical protein
METDQGSVSTLTNERILLKILRNPRLTFGLSGHVLLLSKESSGSLALFVIEEERRRPRSSNLMGKVEGPLIEGGRVVYTGSSIDRNFSFDLSFEVKPQDSGTLVNIKLNMDLREPVMDKFMSRDRPKYVSPSHIIYQHFKPNLEELDVRTSPCLMTVISSGLYEVSDAIKVMRQEANSVKVGLVNMKGDNFDFAAEIIEGRFASTIFRTQNEVIIGPEAVTRLLLSSGQVKLSLKTLDLESIMNSQEFGEE